MLINVRLVKPDGRPKTVAPKIEMLDETTKAFGVTSKMFDGGRRMFHVEQMTVVRAQAESGHP